MKKIRYKGVEIMKPDNLSLNCIKRYIDTVAYSMNVQHHIDFWSKELKNKCSNGLPESAVPKR